jgi:acyl-CoA reductase-like NAD-dependent aldehyde dehydrogenase
VDLINPADGSVIERVEEHTAASVADCYERARTAQPAWDGTPLGERLEIVHGFRDLVEARADDLAERLTTETGKPITQAGREVAGVLDRVDYFLDHTSEVLHRQSIYRDGDGGIEEALTHDPLGVIANVSAWNYPWFVGTNVIVPALLTGNAVLYKPSEHAVRTGLAIADLLHQAGVPPDVFVPLVGGPGVGRAVIDQPVDGVFFTGSHRAGTRISEALAGRFVRLQLELGGKDPAYVTDGSDPAEVAPAVADGAFYNAGQSCCAIERVYVHGDLHDAFVEHFVAAVEGFAVGDPLDPETYLGPLARAEQLDVLDDQVADAVAKGARIVTGGGRRSGPGSWFEPTVLVDVDHDMAIMRDESFGPVIGIQRVADDDEAVAAMNDTAYGLTAAVYGPDRSRAEAILQRLDVGSAYWNCADRVSPRLPWSGRRGSGVGATLGLAGIEAFVRPRAWHLRAQP